jgi:hypothetical protein
MSATDGHIFPSYRSFANLGANLGGWGALTSRAARVEDLVDAWVFAAEDARLALEAWVTSASAERGEAYAVYRAALDREERAAAVLVAAKT